MTTPRRDPATRILDLECKSILGRLRSLNVKLEKYEQTCRALGMVDYAEKALGAMRHGASAVILLSPPPPAELPSTPAPPAPPAP